MNWLAWLEARLLKLDEQMSLGVRLLLMSLLVVAPACTGDPVAESQRHIKRGDEYLAQGKPHEAIIEYRTAVNRAPGLPTAYAKLGAGYLAVDEKEDALAAFVRAADLNPKLVDAQLRAADLLLRGQAYVDARTRARAVLQEEPGNVSALVILGNALAGLRNLDEAIAANERAVELDPSQAGTRVNLGSLRLLQGSEKEAEEAFRSAVSSNAKSVEARIGLASFLWITGRPAEAEREFKVAHALSPTDVSTNRALAAFYMATGRAAEAEGYLRGLVNRTNSRQARMALSDYYVELGRHQEALQILEDLKAGASDSLALDLKIARIVNVSGQSVAASAAIERILEHHPNNPSALAFKTQLLISNNRHAEALATAELAVASDPRSVQAQFALGVAQRANGRIDEARKTLAVVLGMDPYAVGALIELAQVHLAAREMETALGLAERAAQASPTDVEPHLVLARVLSIRPEWSARATAILDSLVKQYPRSSRVQSEVARFALAQGDRMAATRALERASQLEPGRLEPLIELIRLDLAEGNRDSARRRIAAAVAAHPESVQVQLMAAQISFEREPGAAERHLRRVIALDPINLQGYQLLGELLLRQGKAAEARAEFLAIATRQPKLAEPPTMLGLLSGMEGNVPEAEQWFQRALRANPRAAVAANNLAWLYAERGENLETAVQLAQIAHAELPQNLDVKDTLGWAYYKKGLFAFAIRTLTDVVAMQPDNALFQYHLGMAHAGNDEDARARAALERALKLNPNFPGAADARQTLQKLLY